MKGVTLKCGDCLEWLCALDTDAVDVIFTSPPYTDARTYGVGAARNSAEWVEWMRPIVREMCRVSKGIVFLNVSDSVKACAYQNGPEWLHADLTRLDGLAAVRPYIWVKSGPAFDDRGNGAPGSGASHFHRNDYEPIYGYAVPEKLPPRWSDNLAFGLPPLFNAGGPGTQRDKNGKRADDGKPYVPPEISNPGNIIRAAVGGGRLGNPLAHHGEAPMPLGVAERFVCWFCPPGGIILDPFCGTSTTGEAALKHGRRFWGCDLRQSQISLSRRRLSCVTPAMLPVDESDDATAEPGTGIAPAPTLFDLEAVA